MLRIHILNVGHGDSIVLEFHKDNGEVAFAVIDSNCKAETQPPALALLESLKAQSLSFVAITHPHADHYMGMSAILDKFSGRINSIYTFPIRRERADLKKFVAVYSKYAQSTDSAPIHSSTLELAQIVKKAASNVAEFWEDPSVGYKLPDPGFEGVDITTILPHPRVKGDFFQKIDTGNIEPEKEHLNNLSMAFLITYQGQQVILGGDGTLDSWNYTEKRVGKNRYSPVAVKLPHHGSKTDCNERVQRVLFGETLAGADEVARAEGKQKVVACISANGKTHPANEVLEQIVARGILPYCTNLAKRCGAYRNELITAPEVDPALVRLINSAAISDASESGQPCQGNICLEISADGRLNVSTQYANLCPFRGDYGFLSGGVH